MASKISKRCRTAADRAIPPLSRRLVKNERDVAASRAPGAFRGPPRRQVIALSGKGHRRALPDGNPMLAEVACAARWRSTPIRSAGHCHCSQPPKLRLAFATCDKDCAAGDSQLCRRAGPRWPGNTLIAGRLHIPSAAMLRIEPAIGGGNEGRRTYLASTLPSVAAATFICVGFEADWYVIMTYPPGTPNTNGARAGINGQQARSRPLLLQPVQQCSKGCSVRCAGASADPDPCPEAPRVHATWTGSTWRTVAGRDRRHFVSSIGLQRLERRWATTLER